MSHGEFLPGTFLFFAQVIAALLLFTWLIVVIVRSRNHVKHKRTEAEALKKDDAANEQ